MSPNLECEMTSNHIFIDYEVAQTAHQRRTKFRHI